MRLLIITLSILQVITINRWSLSPLSHQETIHSLRAKIYNTIYNLTDI